MNEKQESHKDRNYIEIQFDNLDKTEKVEYAKKLLENVENVQLQMKERCFYHFDIVTNNKAKNLEEHAAHEFFLEESQKLDANFTKSKIKNLYFLKEVDLNSIPVLTKEMITGIHGFLKDIKEDCFGLGMKNDYLYYDLREIVFCHPKVKDDPVNIYNELYDTELNNLLDFYSSKELKGFGEEKKNNTNKHRP